MAQARPVKRFDCLGTVTFAQQGKGGAPSSAGSARFRKPRLEPVPKKLIDFFDSDMLERFLFDRVIPRDREAL
jgi:hypothetical protein